MYVCTNCKRTFEAGITYQNGKHIQLDCPFCRKFIKFIQQPISHPAKEILPFGKYIGKTIEEVWAKDPGYIRWFVGVNGRPGRAAQDFLQIIANAEKEANAENSAIEPASPEEDEQTGFDF